MFETALQMVRALDEEFAIDPRNVVDALCELGAAQCRFGHVSGLERYVEARAVATARGSAFLMAAVLGARAEVLRMLGRGDEARLAASSAAEEFAAIGLTMAARFYSEAAAESEGRANSDPAC